MCVRIFIDNKRIIIKCASRQIFECRLAQSMTGTLRPAHPSFPALLARLGLLNQTDPFIWRGQKYARISCLLLVCAYVCVSVCVWSPLQFIVFDIFAAVYLALTQHNLTVPLTNLTFALNSLVQLAQIDRNLG